MNRSHVRFVLWHPAEGNWAEYDGMEDSLRAQFYRTEAKRLREKAENMDSPEIRQAYEGMAIHYELLLEGLESPAKRSPRGKPRWSGAGVIDLYAPTKHGSLREHPH